MLIRCIDITKIIRRAIVKYLMEDSSVPCLAPAAQIMGSSLTLQAGVVTSSLSYQGVVNKDTAAISPSYLKLLNHYTMVSDMVVTTSASGRTASYDPRSTVGLSWMERLARLRKAADIISSMVDAPQGSGTLTDAQAALIESILPSTGSRGEITDLGTLVAATEAWVADIMVATRTYTNSTSNQFANMPLGVIWDLVDFGPPRYTIMQASGVAFELPLSGRDTSMPTLKSFPYNGQSITSASFFVEEKASFGSQSFSDRLAAMLDVSFLDKCSDNDVNSISLIVNSLFKLGALMDYNAYDRIVGAIAAMTNDNPDMESRTRSALLNLKRARVIASYQSFTQTQPFIAFIQFCIQVMGGERIAKALEDLNPTMLAAGRLDEAMSIIMQLPVQSQVAALLSTIELPFDMTLDTLRDNIFYAFSRIDALTSATDLSLSKPVTQDVLSQALITILNDFSAALASTANFVLDPEYVSLYRDGAEYADTGFVNVRSSNVDASSLPVYRAWFDATGDNAPTSLDCVESGLLIPRHINLVEGYASLLVSRRMKRAGIRAGEVLPYTLSSMQVDDMIDGDVDLMYQQMRSAMSMADLWAFRLPWLAIAKKVPSSSLIQHVPNIALCDIGDANAIPLPSVSRVDLRNRLDNSTFASNAGLSDRLRVIMRRPMADSPIVQEQIPSPDIQVSLAPGFAAAGGGAADFPVEDTDLVLHLQCDLLSLKTNGPDHAFIGRLVTRSSDGLTTVLSATSFTRHPFFVDAFTHWFILPRPSVSEALLYIPSSLGLALAPATDMRSKLVDAEGNLRDLSKWTVSRIAVRHAELVVPRSILSAGRSGQLRTTAGFDVRKPITALPSSTDNGGSIAMRSFFTASDHGVTMSADLATDE